MYVSYRVIGRNIQSVRKQRNLTQQNVADRLGITLLHYGRLERGERKPSLEHLVSIGCILHTPYFIFLYGATDPTFILPAIPEHPSANIVTLLMQGCSESAKTCMLDICRTIAKYDKNLHS